VILELDEYPTEGRWKDQQWELMSTAEAFRGGEENGEGLITCLDGNFGE